MSGIQRRAMCVKAIIAWNREKSWENYTALCKYGYVNWDHIPAPIWAIYTHVKTIWNTLIGKYKKCELGLLEDGRLNYYLEA